MSPNLLIPLVPSHGAPLSSRDALQHPCCWRPLCPSGDKEIVGTLRGFDVYVNMVLEDVQEIEVTPEGKRITKLDQILLNGNNIAVLVPGGKPDDVE